MSTEIQVNSHPTPTSSISVPFPTKASKIQRSSAIAIPNPIQRTQSETLLFEDEVLAEFKDSAMFSLIVDGMTRQQQKARSVDYLYENHACIENIKRSRQLHPNDAESLLSRDKKAWRERWAASRMVKESFESSHQDCGVLFLNAPTRTFRDEDEIFQLDL